MLYRGVIVFDTESGDGRRFGLPRAEAENAIGALVRACQDFVRLYDRENTLLTYSKGIAIPPKPPIIYAGNSNEISPWFNKVFDALNRQPPQLVVCMVSDQSSRNYGAIKSYVQLLG
jgi:hypothetical protein